MENLSLYVYTDIYIYIYITLVGLQHKIVYNLKTYVFDSAIYYRKGNNTHLFLKLWFLNHWGWSFTIR